MQAVSAKVDCSQARRRGWGERGLGAREQFCRVSVDACRPVSHPVLRGRGSFDGQPGQVSYAASKGAIASLTLPLTRDLARYGVRVVTVAPSLFDSGMTALMSEKVRASLIRVMEFPLRPCKPEEFARVVKEGIENPMLNGTVIRLDGGMRMPSKM